MPMPGTSRPVRLLIRSPSPTSAPAPLQTPSSRRRSGARSPGPSGRRPTSGGASARSLAPVGPPARSRFHPGRVSPSASPPRSRPTRPEPLSPRRAFQGETTRPLATTPRPRRSSSSRHRLPSRMTLVGRARRRSASSPRRPEPRSPPPRPSRPASRGACGRPWGISMVTASSRSSRSPVTAGLRKWSSSSSRSTTPGR